MNDIEKHTKMSNQQANLKSFRSDINGLRAWAVIAVILYHFSIPGFTGGFVGVDIFFVISGFLMTQIVVQGLEQGNFSFWGFYLARARRIIPALLVLSICLMLLGWFWLVTPDYQALGEQVESAMVFISNIIFYYDAGYFDTASHEKWLLHTWSLSVEWQFYTLLPLASLLIWRYFGASGIKYMLIICGISSFAFSLYMLQQSPDATFYLLQYRAWEMIIGGGVWWVTRQRTLPENSAKILEYLGFGLIGYAIISLNSTIAWPGLHALLPVSGAVLVLIARQQQSWLTGNWLAQRLGKSSYSLYLWHWPLVVALNYSDNMDKGSWVVTALLLTLLLGELSLKFIENPCRQQLVTRDALKGSVVLILAIIAVGLMGHTIYHQKIPGRLPEAEQLAAAESKNDNPKKKQCLLRSKRGGESPLCQFGSGAPNMIVMGDSHANAVISAAGEVASAHNGSALELSLSICTNLLGVQRAGDKRNACQSFNEKYISQLSTTDFLADIPLVLMTRHSYYLLGPNEAYHRNFGKALVYFSKYSETPNETLNQEYRQALIETTCQLAESRPVYLVRPIPEMGINVPKTMARRLMLGQEDVDISISVEQYHQRHAVIWAAQDDAAAQCGATILNPLPYLCHDGRCISNIAGRPLYYDDDHLSEYGNKLLKPMFEEVFAPQGLIAGRDL